jgi:hypothetical protein
MKVALLVCAFYKSGGTRMINMVLGGMVFFENFLG